MISRLPEITFAPLKISWTLTFWIVKTHSKCLCNFQIKKYKWVKISSAGNPPHEIMTGMAPYLLSEDSPVPDPELKLETGVLVSSGHRRVCSLMHYKFRNKTLRNPWVSLISLQLPLARWSCFHVQSHSPGTEIHWTILFVSIGEVELFRHELDV